VDKLDNILGKTKQLKAPKWVKGEPISRDAWEEAVGSRIARRTEPLRIDRGVLWVRVATSAWANELSLLTHDILEQLNSRGFEIEGLRFRVGAISRKQRKQSRGPVREAPPDNPPLPDQVREKVEHVSDDALKRALAIAAAKSLAVAKLDRSE
jgi:hypothetical protein